MTYKSRCINSCYKTISRYNYEKFKITYKYLRKKNRKKKLALLRSHNILNKLLLYFIKTIILTLKYEHTPFKLTKHVLWILMFIYLNSLSTYSKLFYH